MSSLSALKNSTTVLNSLAPATEPLPHEPSPAEFYARALALRLPILPNRIKRAVDLFCQPMPGTRARALSEPAPDFQRERVISRGIDYQSYVSGTPKSQPYVLCSHGWGSFGLRFAPWREALAAQGMALVSFDHQAHGQSHGQQVTLPGFVSGVMAMIERYGVPVACVGHSFGGAALALAAAEEGVRVPMVLVAPPSNLEQAVRYFIQRCGLPAELRQPMLEELHHRTGRDIRDLRAKFTAARVRQPLLVIHDLMDHDVSWSAGAEYALQAPHARMLTLNGLGHHRILNDAITINAALAHIRGEAVGEKLMASDLDLQLILG